MTAGPVWTYALVADAPPGLDLPEALRPVLAKGAPFEAILAAVPEAPEAYFRLDAAGLIARTLQGGAGALATCRPDRAPDRPAPTAPPKGLLRLSPAAFARADGGAITLETPGAWASVVLHDPALLPILGALAEGATVDACRASLHAQDAATVAALVQLFDWCDLLAEEATPAFAPHERLMHVRTRLGYGRQPIGKIGTASPPPTVARPALATIRLPDPGAAEAPSLDTVLRARRSRRTHGPVGMDRVRLSRFLSRTLRDRDGRRPYPSGGACYAVNAYLAIRLCQDVPPGLYAYRPDTHVLDKVAEDGSGLNRLLADAATAAASPNLPQMLLILSADMARVQPVYGGLSYSLVLKETGAILQTAMLAAAADGLAACPLGTGNTRLFSWLAGLDPQIETSVGEVMLGLPPASGHD
jgi:SagB-type dehydrogenase family enzyme